MEYYVKQNLRSNSKGTRGKNDFTEGSKILLDIDQKIILLDHQNKLCWNLKNSEQCYKKL